MSGNWSGNKDKTLKGTGKGTMRKRKKEIIEFRELK